MCGKKCVIVMSHLFWHLVHLTGTNVTVHTRGSFFDVILVSILSGCAAMVFPFFPTPSALGSPFSKPFNWFPPLGLLARWRSSCELRRSDTLVLPFVRRFSVFQMYCCDKGSTPSYFLLVFDFPLACAFVTVFRMSCSFPSGSITSSFSLWSSLCFAYVHKCMCSDVCTLIYLYLHAHTHKHACINKHIDTRQEHVLEHDVGVPVR